VLTGAGEPVFELPFAEPLNRQAGLRPINLSRAVKTAPECGHRMRRLSAEVAEPVRLVQEDLARSQDLLNDLGKSCMG